MAIMKLILYFFSTDLSQHFGIYVVVLHSMFLLMAIGNKKSLKVICVVKSKDIQP